MLAGPATAHQNEETTTPSLTETVEASPTFDDALTASGTNPIDPTLTESLGVEATPSPTPSQTSTAPPAPEIGGNYLQDEVIVRFKKSATDKMISTCLSQVNGREFSRIDELGVVVIKVPAGSVSKAVASLSGCAGVRYAEPNFIASIADTIPSDPEWGLQYGLVNIRAPQGWDITTGSATVTIAIVDTGVSLSHPDLAGKIVGGYDFVNDDNVADDDHGHGTHVAGIAAAMSNNGNGIAGVSWGARIMPVKVLNLAGGGSYADVAAGITFAVDSGAQVINLSLGGEFPSVFLQDAVDYASSRGAVVVAASGNTGTDNVLYPAAYGNVIAVSAVDNLNNRAAFSNYGPAIDLAAPGVTIYSTSPGGTYTYRSGTSMAAPFVSGLAAILRGFPGNGSPDAIKMEMESSALDLGPAGWDEFYGFGLIQMDAAILSVNPLTPPPNGPEIAPTQFYFSMPSTSTPTSTATTVPSTPTPSSTAEATKSSNITSTPELRIQETAGNEFPNQGPAVKIPPTAWMGLCLILLGLLLFLYGRVIGRRKRNRVASRR
jgi:thermitase